MNPFTFKLFTNKIFRQTNKFISCQNKINVNKLLQNNTSYNTSYNNFKYYNFYKNYIKR
jgi:hypothetical protein